MANKQLSLSQKKVLNSKMKRHSKPYLNTAAIKNLVEGVVGGPVNISKGPRKNSYAVTQKTSDGLILVLFILLVIVLRNGGTGLRIV